MHVPCVALNLVDEPGLVVRAGQEPAFTLQRLLHTLRRDRRNAPLNRGKIPTRTGQEDELKVFLAGRVSAESDGVVSDERRFHGRQGRLLFAYLVAEQGRAVPRDELAEALWGAHPPTTWDKALSVLVSKLRALLAEHGVDGAVALTSAFGCYRLELPEGAWVDIIAGTDAVRDAEHALARGDAASARTAAADAASLMGQSFLPGDDGTWVDEKRRELADAHMRALDVLVAASLALGDGREAGAWAEEAIVLEPFRESGYRQLMRAQAASGNPAEALRTYERCRRLLADELGTYPSSETEALYRRLLESPAPAETENGTGETPPASATPRRRAMIVAAVIAAGAGAVIGIVATSGGTAHAKVAPNSVVALNPSGSVAATVSVGARPVAMTSARGALWVANLADESVTRVDLASRQAVRSIPLGRAPSALAATKNGIWVAVGSGRVLMIDPTYDRLLADKHITGDDVFYRPDVERTVLAAFGALWVVDPAGSVTRFDAAAGRATGSVDVGNDPTSIGAGDGSVWVTNGSDGTVSRIDPVTLVATTIPVGHDPAAIAVDSSGVWVANAGEDAVVRVDPETNAVAATAHVGSGPSALVATPLALWVANSRDGSVMRLDPNTGRIQRRVELGGTPDALTAADGKVWVAVAPAPPATPAGGRVLHLTSDHDFATLDPALDLNPQLVYATCANLVTHPDKPAPEGSLIVPEVAEAVPAPTNGGKTYTFDIRPGYRFSPPSNAPVTATAFKSAIERAANPRLKSPLAYVFRDVASITARRDRLTITLSRPNGGFLADLADTEAACAVPPGTPATAGGIDDIPSAGPYYFASYTPRQQLVLERNPNYHGDRPRRFLQIVVAIGVDSSRALHEVEAGTSDYALEGPPRDAGPKLASTYGPGSTAARELHQQYFISEAAGARYLHMNTSRPLFANARLRRAVNYAIDRRALVAQGKRFAEVNPFNSGTPSDDYLPPLMTGVRNLHVYPLGGPDLRRAKQLAGRVHATAIMYTPNLPPWLQEAQIVRRDLRPLGIDVQVREMPIDDFFERIGRPREPYDLAVSGWSFSSDPIGAFTPSTGVLRLSHFHDPAFDRQVRAAERLSGTRRYRAADRLALELDRDLAPAAPFATDASRDFFSARIGCQVYQPFFEMDLGALCLRDS
ncbi:MAG TPA: ABC transporter substrate-binding protein [Gaiellaceae bacterium]|nr:ABC transporter substrate-binding protein [Gaiellaceae bacterium]